MHTSLKSAAALLLLVACGSSPELPEPWSAYDLPTRGATLQKSDDKELHLVYEGKSRVDLFAAYREALVSQGFTALEPLAPPGMISTTLHRGDDSIELIVASKGKRADVLLSR